MIRHINNRKSTLLDNKYWEFFIPTILMAMTLTMSVVVDAVIVGNMLGSEALAAVNLVMPVIMIYNTVAVSLGMGGATLISVAKGRRQGEYANDIFTVVLIGLFSVSFLLLACQELFLVDITKILTREPSLRPLVSAYLHVLVYGTPLIIIVLGLVYSLRIDGRVKLASTVLIASNLVNLVLDLVYMGPMKLGIAGSSLATVSGYAVGAGFLFVYIFSNKRTLRFSVSTLLRLPKFGRCLLRILSTGTPAAMGSILVTIKILCINHIVLAVAGKSGMVAFSVCLSCLSFVSMFISGAAQAMTPIVGVLYGENDYTGVHFVVLRAAKTLLVSSVLVTLLLECVPGIVLQMFGVHHPADIAEGIPAIRLFSLSLVGTSITFLSIYYFMTIGRTKFSTVISMVEGLSVIPIALTLSQLWGSAGVWIAFSMAEIVTISMIVTCCIYLMRKSPEAYKSPLLLDRRILGDTRILETTITSSNELREGAREGIAGLLDSLEIKQEKLEMIRKAVIKAVDDVAEQAYPQGERGYLDLLVRVYDDRIVASLRDNGMGVDLSGNSFLSQSLPDSVKIEQAQAIGFNTITLTSQ
ncbi:MATE family efflux transporter [Desulfopila sp. IMCC35008]|uniref:MATE family efflux transporter n=1 Tax=Desulfopila sp. IMCC35008 TaxID=2653858 RepID=UPI0013D3316C|nr:MATE family efflux transporter [Desulfopila sp. IMCC35008]